MQAAITKRYSNGLLFSFNYVWSHFLDDQDSGGWGSRGGTQYWQIGNNPGANYGNSNFDIPSAFKGYVSYELPFGKGKMYMSDANALANAAVGGWRIAGTVVAQSGNPFTVVNNTNQNSTITGCERRRHGIRRRRQQRLQLVSQRCGQYPRRQSRSQRDGLTPQLSSMRLLGGNSRSAMRVETSLRGPRLTVFNFSLAKNFSFGERIRLELRSDWVNVFNHPSLGIPGQSFGAANFGR